MSKNKTISFYIRIIFILILATFLFANAKDELIHEWENVTYTEGNEIPFSTFSINLKIDSNNYVKGTFCYIKNYVKRIDCDNAFNGKLINKELVFSFNSSFGGKNGRAKIKLINDCTLLWEILKKPEGEAYIPNKKILKPVIK